MLTRQERKEKRIKSHNLVVGTVKNLRPGPDYQDLPDGYDGPIKLINWNGYKIAVLDSGGLTTQFFDQVAARRKNNQSVIIIITASPGEGKSYMAMRFAQIFDPKFHVLDLHEKPLPEEDPSQIVFERQHFHYLIGNNTPLVYGQCLMSDEAQYAMGARNWYVDIQKDLVESIESVRSKGLIIVIVALHLELLDKIIRKFVLTYMFHVEARGRAVVYRLYTPRFEKEMRKHRLGELYLKLPDFEKCSHRNCLQCKFSGVMKRQWQKREKWEEIGYKPCKSIRAIYERRKKEFVSTRSDHAADKAAQKAVRERVIPDKQLAQAFVDYHKENPSRTRYNNRKDIESAYIQIVLEDKLGVTIGVGKAVQLRTRMYIEHPELTPENRLKEEE